jgi:ABC-type ATPase involved in cell division
MVVDSGDARPLDLCQGRISFRNVDFAYDIRKPALHDISFDVEPGTSTAIVGESGSGKSTIIKLLFRFYDPSSGSVRIDGENVRNFTVESLRRHLGVVPQDTILFNETLMYNLMYSKPDCTEEKVFAACKSASIHDKIMAFPNGYDTAVGERGLKLSGGEKQRVRFRCRALESIRNLPKQSSKSTDRHRQNLLAIAHDSAARRSHLLSRLGDREADPELLGSSVGRQNHHYYRVSHSFGTILLHVTRIHSFAAAKSKQTCTDLSSPWQSPPLHHHQFGPDHRSASGSDY